MQAYGAVGAAGAGERQRAEKAKRVARSVDLGGGRRIKEREMREARADARAL
eukprot:COSAG01_NODE_66510_length_270_cov_0.526316_1_plen_51_part_10